MKIVIEIPEHDKNVIERFVRGDGCEDFPPSIIENLIRAVYFGTPLPKGHGKIKDIDKIEWYGCTTEFDCPHKDRECKDCNKARCSKTQVDAIPTIIEADKESEE